MLGPAFLAAGNEKSRREAGFFRERGRAYSARMRALSRLLCRAALFL